MSGIEGPHYYLYFLSIWVILFASGSLLHARHFKSILLSGLLALPQSLFSPLVVPIYWEPEFHLLFGLVGVEDILFSFLTGAVVWTCVLVFFRHRKPELAFSPRKVVLYFLACTAFGAVSATLLFLIGVRNINNPFLIMTLWILIVLLLRPGYLKLAAGAACSFLLLYALAFKLSIVLWPEFISYWNLSNLSGICLEGIPLEELEWAFLYGASWSLGVAFIMEFREKS